MNTINWNPANSCFDVHIDDGAKQNLEVQVRFVGTLVPKMVEVVSVTGGDEKQYIVSGLPTMPLAKPVVIVPTSVEQPPPLRVWHKVHFTEIAGARDFQVIPKFQHVNNPWSDPASASFVTATHLAASPALPGGSLTQIEASFALPAANAADRIGFTVILVDSAGGGPGLLPPDEDDVDVADRLKSIDKKLDKLISNGGAPVVNGTTIIINNDD